MVDVYSLINCYFSPETNFCWTHSWKCPSPIPKLSCFPFTLARLLGWDVYYFDSPLTRTLRVLFFEFEYFTSSLLFYLLEFFGKVLRLVKILRDNQPNIVVLTLYIIGPEVYEKLKKDDYDCKIVCDKVGRECLDSLWICIVTHVRSSGASGLFFRWFRRSPIPPHYFF